MVFGCMTLFLFACAQNSTPSSAPSSAPLPPPSPLLRDRFAATPRPAPAPEGALLSIPGSPWGLRVPPAHDSRVVTFDTGRFAIFDGRRWQLWDPERGLLREVSARGEPTPDGAWLISDPHESPVRLDTDLVVDGVREARVGELDVRWGEALAEATANKGEPPPDPLCQRSWRSGSQHACYERGTLCLFEGDELLDSWSGHPSSLSWSADGETFAWSGDGLLTLRHDDWQNTIQVSLARMALSQDGSLVIGWDNDGFVIIDTETGEHLGPKSSSFPSAATLGPDGEIAAWTSDGTLHTWDKSGRVLGQAPAPALAALTWGRDGLCGSSDTEQLCFNADLTQRSRLEIPSGSRAIGAHLIVPVQGGSLIDGRLVRGHLMSFDASGERVSLWHEGASEIIDLSTGMPVSWFPEPFSGDSLSRGGDKAVSRGGRRLERRADGTLVVWPEVRPAPSTSLPLDQGEWGLWTVVPPVSPADCDEGDPQFIPGPDRRLSLADQTVPVVLPTRGVAASGGGRAAIVNSEGIYSVDPLTSEYRREDSPWDLWLPDGRWAGAMVERVEQLASSGLGARLAARTSAGRLFIVERASGAVDARCVGAIEALSFDGEVLLLDGGRVVISPDSATKITSAAGMDLRIDDEGEVFASWSRCGWFHVALDGSILPSTDPGLPKRAPKLRQEGETLLVESLDPSQRGCLIHDPLGAVASPSGRHAAWAGPGGVWRADLSTCAARSPEPPATQSRRSRSRSPRQEPIVTLGERSYVAINGRVGAFDRREGEYAVLSGAEIIAFSHRPVVGRIVEPSFHPRLENIEAIAALPTGELAVAKLGKISLVEPW